MLTRAGEQREGLYYFKNSINITSVKTSNRASFDLWHQRLGHASFQAVALLPNIGFAKSSDLCTPKCDTSASTNDSFSSHSNGDLDTTETISLPFVIGPSPVIETPVLPSIPDTDLSLAASSPTTSTSDLAHPPIKDLQATDNRGSSSYKNYCASGPRPTC
ncbi:hypothetical protein L6164_033459 [Bauhinia variegata]|uniref:Uncharacterized protein n=1 Tax=Bauhinia variegata TaxID=167791 RepID=A0ACB9KRU4_BAUVA|nr:hypothetical protein L6164_033459 [Bauhinia variegata]